MTIVVGVSAPDGIILAADSRTTVMRPDGLGGFRPRIASDNAEKVFDVCGGYGVATFGDAFIGTQTIAGLMVEFEATVDGEELPVEQFAARLGEFFDRRYRAEREVGEDEIGNLGFLVAGYDGQGVGHIHEVLVPTGDLTDTDLNTSDGTGFAFRGMTDVINRLTRGVDWVAIAELGIPIEPDLAAQLEQVTYELVYPITVQDALDLAVFLIRTTIDMQRFSDGVIGRPGGWSGCGGPISAIAVQPERVEFVSRPALKVRHRTGEEAR
jgi:hypothetical protein